MIDYLHIASKPQPGNTFLIVDGAQLPELPATLYRYTSNILWRSLYQATYLEPLINISPVLCDISDAQHFLQWLAENHGNCPWGIGIRSQSYFDQTWRHLQSICWASSSMGEKVLLRYYDPRIAEKLFQIKHESTHSLLGPIDQIWVPKQSHGHAHLAQLELPRCSSYSPPGSPKSGWFTLQAFHEQAIEQTHEEYLRDTIAAHVKEYFPSKWNDISRNGQEGWVQKRMDQARELGLESPQDMLLLINIICFLGENCLEDSTHPAIQLLSSESPLPVSERLNQAATLLENET